jgi:protein-S-isoprenylcysteine O-methyltransferase Ste14
VSFAIVFAPGWLEIPPPALPGPAVWVCCILVLFLATASVWMVVAARRVLGKQWSYEARLVEGHRLVVEGPYSHVRHPIYTAMLGMLLATGFTFSVWWALSAAIVLFAAGTAVRIRAEERLLRGAFGDDFEAYRRYVPAIIPRWKT